MSHGYVEVKGWDNFQHYKKRSPPWIKLHAALLDNYEFARLPDISKAHLVGIWILASKHANKVPADPEWIARRIGATDPVDIEPLVEAGFIARLRRASDPLPERKQMPIPEVEGEREGESKAEKSTTTSAVAADSRIPGHTLRSVLGLVVEHLYSGIRPPEAAMRNEASIAKALGERHGYDVLARGIQGLARRRDSGEFPNIRPRQAMGLKWINSAKFDINQLAASEDAFYRSDPEPRRGRGKVTDIGDIVATITPRTA